MKLLATLLLSALLPGQATWWFREVVVPTCPGWLEHPRIDPDQPLPVFAAGSATVTWRGFTPNTPVVLLMQVGFPSGWWAPCALVDAQFCLTTMVNPWGQARFIWQVPANSPVIGTALLGHGQVVELAVPPTLSSYVFEVLSIR